MAPRKNKKTKQQKIKELKTKKVNAFLQEFDRQVTFELQAWLKVKKDDLLKKESEFRLSKMPSNVEIKARVTDATLLAEKARQLSQSEGTVIRQHDTFFNCSNGRLKLRDFMDGTGQLIFYDRPDSDGPKLSSYSITPTQNPDDLKKVLSDAHGIKGEVRKERHLYLIGQTRVHLDTVEGLGHYMELEVVMRPDQSVEEGQQVARDLMKALGVSDDSLVTGAYMDLLLNGRSK